MEMLIWLGVKMVLAQKLSLFPSGQALLTEDRLVLAGKVGLLSASLFLKTLQL